MAIESGKTHTDNGADQGSHPGGSLGPGEVEASKGLGISTPANKPLFSSEQTPGSAPERQMLLGMPGINPDGTPNYDIFLNIEKPVGAFTGFFRSRDRK